MEVFGGFFKFLLVYFTSFRVKSFSSVVFHQYPCFGVLSNGLYVSIEILLDKGGWDYLPWEGGGLPLNGDRGLHP